MINFVFIVGTLGVIGVIATQTTNATEVGKATILSTLIETFIKPYLATLNTGNIEINPQIFRSHKKQEKDFNIKNLIREKVVQLQPYLQDNEHFHEINLHENGTSADDTTIIEFTPSSHTDIRTIQTNSSANNTQTIVNTASKYKEIRDQVNTMMKNEKTSKKIKHLVLNTLDDMIAQMVASRCSWRTNQETPDQIFQRQNAKTRKAIERLYHMTNNQWIDLKQEFAKYLENKHTKEVSFIEQFQEFFRTLLSNNVEATKFPDEYKIQCKLVRYKKQTEEIQYRGEATPATESNTPKISPDINKQCARFKICTEELNDFLNKLYKDINETSVSIFKNYEAMYSRDVNTKINPDKALVADVLNTLSSKVEAQVSKIFVKNMDQFHLDKEKVPKKNIKFIRKFIKHTTSQVNKSILKLTKNELITDANKLYATMKDDLAVNTNLDLNNLETELLDGICKNFYVCNGKYLASRRSSSPDAGNYVLVKMKINLDDDVKQAMREGTIWKPWENKLALQTSTRDKKSKFKKQYNTKFHITRTTAALD